MTKLLKISALSALTLLFAACDPEMTGAELEDRAHHGKMLDIVDADDDGDGGFDILDDFSDAEPAPAPMVEYDLDFAAEDEEPCDTWGPEGDLDLDHGVDGQAAVDGQRPLGIDPDQGDESWGPDDDDLDINGDADGAGDAPSDDDEPPIGLPDDEDDDWDDLPFDGANNSGDGPVGDDEPPIGTPDDEDNDWGDLDFDGDNSSDDDDDDDIDDIDGN